MWSLKDGFSWWIILAICKFRLVQSPFLSKSRPQGLLVYYQAEQQTFCILTKVLDLFQRTAGKVICVVFILLTFSFRCIKTTEVETWLLIWHCRFELVWSPTAVGCVTFFHGLNSSEDYTDLLMERHQCNYHLAAIIEAKGWSCFYLEFNSPVDSEHASD